MSDIADRRDKVDLKIIILRCYLKALESMGTEDFDTNVHALYESIPAGLRPGISFKDSAAIHREALTKLAPLSKYVTRSAMTRDLNDKAEVIADGEALRVFQELREKLDHEGWLRDLGQSGGFKP